MSRREVGDWVEVRSKEEILRTLDKQGKLDGLPFMPQMFKYCGKRFRVYRRAHKTCDTIVFDWNSPGRSLADGVHLNLRCDGETHGGCHRFRLSHPNRNRFSVPPPSFIVSNIPPKPP